jgi:predicted Zn-dependent peptidase
MDKIIHPYITKINNLKCVLVNFPCSHVVSAGFFVKVGSAYEEKSVRGVSHFLEHMLFKKRTNKLDELGISYNAATSRDYTYYECHGSSDQIKDIILLLFMIMTQPAFEEKEIKSERNVIFEEMKGDQMSYTKQLYEVAINNIYKNKNKDYALPIIGNVDTLNNMNIKKLKEYFDEYYHYDNSTLVIVGNMNKQSVLQQIKTLVNKYPRTGTKTCDINIIDGKIEKDVFIRRVNNLPQTMMMINFYIKDLTEIQKNQFYLFNHILTGNFMSILVNELRVKRGLCYGITSDIMLVKTNDLYNGIFYIKVDSDPSKIKECLKLILQIILHRKINKASYINSKKSLNNILSFSFQTSKDYLYYFGTMMLNNDTILPQQIMDILKKTTIKDINNLLAIIKKGELFVNMIGTFGSKK